MHGADREHQLFGERSECRGEPGNVRAASRYKGGTDALATAARAAGSLSAAVLCQHAGLRHGPTSADAGQLGLSSRIGIVSIFPCDETAGRIGTVSIFSCDETFGHETRHGAVSVFFHDKPAFCECALRSFVPSRFTSCLLACSLASSCSWYGSAFVHVFHRFWVCDDAVLFLHEVRELLPHG